MAQKVSVNLVDDLDGSAADQTVEFGLDGVAYEIDLSHANAGKLRKELDEFVNNARRTGGRYNGGRFKRATEKPVRSMNGRWQQNRDQNAAVRSWANAHGYKVPDRGRIAQSVREAFDAAHA
jgi:hypothetical protein